MATIHIQETTHKQLKTYCTKNGLTHGDFVNSALAYFSKSGIDPNSPPESVKEEIAKVDKRISQLIAFQKTFEQKQLIPLIESLYKIEAEIREQQSGGNFGEQLNRISQQLALINPAAINPAAKIIPQAKSGGEDEQLKHQIEQLELKYNTVKNRYTLILTHLQHTRKGYLITLGTSEVEREIDFLKKL